MMLQHRHCKHAMVSFYNRCIRGIYIYMYVCLCRQRFQQSMAHLGIVPNPARGQLKRDSEVFPFILRA